MTHALVIATGADVDAVAAAGRADLVVCADGGLEVALAAERAVDVVVGDLDSASPEAVERARALGTRFDAHPEAKDESDLELALATAVAAEATEITVLLAAGGRPDHQLANLLVLGSERWAGASIDAVVGHDRAWVVRGARRLPIGEGAALSIHAIGGPAHGVATRGLAYELRQETLDPLAARGISNLTLAAAPTIGCRDGVLLVLSWPTP